MQHFTSFANSILQHAKKHLQKIAIVDKNATRFTSWQELETLSYKITHYAKSQNIKGIVPVVQGRTMEYIATVLGLNLAGIGVSPLTKDYPIDRIEFIKNELDAKIIADEDFVEQAKKTDIDKDDKETLKQVQSDGSGIQGDDGEVHGDCKECGDIDTIAFVFYTSGSTGNPKGVVHDNKTILQSFESASKIYELSDSSIAASCASFNFCAILADLFTPLFCGSQVHILTDENRKDINLFEQYLYKNEITFAFVSPRMLQKMTLNLPKMKVVITAGEKVCNIQPKNYKIFSLYGMTETASIAFSFLLDKSYDNTPIGKPLSCNKVYLLDENGNETTEGELCISGNIAKGYWKNLQETKKTFTQNPFYKKEVDKENHKILLHTGDIAKKLSDGNYLFLNRKDFMIKINGQRVEPGEIENQIKKIDGVTEAVVKGFENSFGQTYLCAWYCTNKDVKEIEVKKYLEKKLSSYMIPSFILKVESFEVNQNGKLDRKKLLAPDVSIFKAEYKEPTTEIEKIICTAFEKVLNVSKIGIDDDFFSLGGNSILAVLLCSKIKECSKEKIDIKTSSIFINRTPKEIARNCQNDALKQVQGDGGEFQKDNKKIANDNNKIENCSLTYYPLTVGQMGVYYACIQNPKTLMYNLPIACKLPLSIDSQKLGNAIKTVVNNFSAFSVCFKVINDQVQMVKKTPRAQIEVVEKNENEIEQLKKDFIKPFDLESGELSRFTICKTQNSIWLLADFHHIIFDGTSVGIFFNNLSKVYQEKDFEKESISIFEQSLIEQEESKTQDYQNAHDFFAEKISNFDFQDSLLQDYFDIEKNDDKNNLSPVTTIESNITESINSINIENYARKIGITEAAFFTGTFAYVFSKMLGDEGANFCTVNSGRHFSNLNNTIGMFVRTLPLCIFVDENQSANDFLLNFSKTFYQTIANDVYPFSALATEFGITNDTMFVYQDESLNSFSINKNIYPIEMLETKSAFSKLTVQVFKQNGIYKASFKYRSDLYSKSKINNFIELYKNTVASFIKNVQLKNIPLVTQTQLEKLEMFHGAKTDYKITSVVELLKESFAKNPNKIALVCGDKKITYKKLDEQTDKIATVIKSKGIKKEDVVAILTDRNEMMAIAPIAVAKTGAIYLPLDSSYPAERLTFMVKDSGAKLLLCPKELRYLVECEIETIEFSNETLKQVHGDGISIQHEKVKPSPNDGFVILYTSGSTGNPKGVILEHKNIVQFVYSYAKWSSLSKNSKVPSYASFGFDANIWDTIPTLCMGATLYIIPYQMRLDLEKLNAYFQECGITHSFLTTQIGRQFVTEHKNDSLQLLMTGGETLTPCNPPHNYTFANVYGPTETTIIVSGFKVDKYYHNVPIGKPLDGINLYIVDKYFRRVPVGVPGELCISGNQVARGYLNNPEKTVQVFVDNPFEKKVNKNSDYKKMYRTGDVVCFLPDGNLQFVGRKDSQVKVRGFRIELIEVEEIIRRFPNIKDVTVKIFDDSKQGKFITAYIVSDNKIDIEKLNEFIRAEKPSYMVPSVTIQIEKIPLNQNGKVNKKNLPIPKREVKNIVKPQTKNQILLLDILSKVLGYSDFGIITNIFDAGLNSINSIKFISLLSKEFSKSISIKELKENDTIEKLEKFITSKKENETFEILENYPITKTQEGIFFECLNKPNSTFYNIPCLIKLENKIDIQKLKNAIAQTINAHPYVMTTFFMLQDGIFCKREKNIKFNNFDIEEIKTDNIEELKQNICKPFELQNSRLFRIKIIYSSDKSIRLYFDFHHIIFDGSSLEIFLQDIERSYNGKFLEVEKFSPFEYALQENQLRKTSLYENAKLYYSNLFCDYLQSSLPFGDFPEKIGFRGEIFEAEKLSVDSINLFCKKNNVTQNSLFTSAFGFLLAKYTNEEKSVFTTIYNGRNDSRFSKNLAMYVKTFPVLCDIKNKSCDDYVKQISNQLENSKLNDLYSFSEIKNDLEINSDVMFIFQNEGIGQKTFCNQKLNLEKINIDFQKSTLSVSVTIKNQSIFFEVEFDNSKYSIEYIQHLIKTYEVVLKEIVEKNNLDEISLVNESDIKLLENFHGAKSNYKKCSVVELLKEGFAKNPNKIAVVSGNKKITYEELDELTDKIAMCLKNKHIGKEDVVAILTQRNEMMAIAPIAVIKTGAAYLPLDNTYPAERLTFMIKDSGAKLLLCPKDLRHLVECDIETIELSNETLKQVQSYESAILQDKSIPTPNDAFVILYSSGTTGNPKGCVLEHKNFAHFLQFFDKRFSINETSNIASYASFGFDQSVNDLFCSMITGATLHIIPLEMRLDFNALNAYFEQNKITHSFMTTGVGRQFSTNIKNHSLKYLIMGGEALTPLEPPKNYTIVNGYGPTETTCGVSVFDIDKLYHCVPLGRINDGLKAYIVDKNLDRVPIGVPGELCIAGPQVSRCYLNLPQKTNEVFIENPFIDTSKKENLEYKKMYRTGDVVCFLPDGNLQFIGRKDSQVKIRGFRIELSEVEEIINRFDGIKNSTVQVYEDENIGKILVAYIVSDKKIDIEKLKSFIILEKPNYMVPSCVMQIDSIPLTQNQKVNKKLLPKPHISFKKYVEPKNKIEKDFCDIMAQALNLKQYSAEDNFFEVGGSSILATKVLVSALAKDYKISYSDLFKYKSPKKIAQFINSISSEKMKIESQNFSEIQNYDYSKINELISNVTIKKIDECIEKDSSIIKGKIGNVFLTGTTGFLGMHVLYEYIKNYKGTIYCMIRSSKTITAKEKLKTLLMYYFSQSFEEEFSSNRIVCVETSFEDLELEEKLKNIAYNTIINCAACVKHFIADDTLYNVNTLGTQKLLSIAEKNKKRFIQISTYSVAGSVTENLSDSKFSEQNLFIGQEIKNEYIRTKFLAERIVLEAALRGANVKILRLGNLMSRYSDGEFQINFVTNGFMRDLRGVTELGFAPKERNNKQIDFSPIDNTACAVLKIADSDLHSYIYHVYNPNKICARDLLDVCRECGFNINEVSEEEYRKQIDIALKKNQGDDFKSDIIGGLIAYKDSKTGKEIETVSTINNFTVELLNRLNFTWQKIGKKQIKNIIENLIDMGFFDLNFNKKGEKKNDYKKNTKSK